MRHIVTVILITALPMCAGAAASGLPVQAESMDPGMLALIVSGACFIAAARFRRRTR